MKKLYGELNFSRERVASVVIGKRGQLLRKLLLQTDRDCGVNIYIVRRKTVSQEVLDRLVGRDDDAFIASWSLHGGESVSAPAPSMMPLELRVVGEKGGHLLYSAVVEDG